MNSYPTYNCFCPPDEDCDCGYKPVGCGAVAMGQIMWYWEWPATYNWSIMPCVLINEGSGAEAVAHLLRDCGDAAGMTYWCSGSWTTTNAIEDAFKSMGYNGVEKKLRSYWPDNETWLDIIRDEIFLGRPVLYRGDNCDICTMKHFFVIDGYEANDENLFHINWGWGGTDNGFYNLSDLTPGNYEFNENQMAIVGISPTCSGVASDITDVDYTTVSGNVYEYAINSISLPANNKTLEVLPGGNLTLKAGNSVLLAPGFTAYYNSTFESYLAPSKCSDECGLELIYIDNALVKGYNNPYGWFEIIAPNANSYDFRVLNYAGELLFQGAGLLENNIITTIWQGEGVDIEGTYVYALTLFNNCGERFYKVDNVVVLMGDSDSKYIVDIVEGKVLNNFNVFPNPNNGNFVVKSNHKDLPYSINIYNNLGQTIFSDKNISTDDYQIRLNDVIPGYYLIKIISKNKIFNFKCVIKL